MNRFSLFILAEVDKHPSFSAKELAEHLFLPEKAVQDAIHDLYLQNILLPQKQGFYMTFLGRTTLMKFDFEKAESILHERQEMIKVVCETLQISPQSIHQFTPMAQGMTNRSFLVEIEGKQYIFRLPGEGTDQLVDRYREYSNYLALEGSNIADTVVYHNPITGIKMTEFIADCRTPDKTDTKDLQLCMAALRRFHESGITVEHTFDFAERISYYETLCLQGDLPLPDGHVEAKQLVQNLLLLLQQTEKETCFCHIDSVPGNFLIMPDDTVALIDWEYAGMCDPVADASMWCLSARYDKEACDDLLPLYLTRTPTQNEWLRFYAYLALGGFMWGLWATYKASLGETYGEYIDQMFGYCMQFAPLALQLAN